MGPRVGREGLSPRCHRLPRSLGATPSPCVLRQWGLQVAKRRGAGHAQHIALAPLAQFATKLRVATQLIITRDPAVRHLLSPRVEHLQTLFLPRLIAYLQRHVACLASLLVAGPLLRQKQAEVEQDMVVVRDVAHEDADLAVVHLAPVAAPLPLYSHRMRPALGEATGIEGDDPIGFAQPRGHLSD